jgi:hypothetical protein
LNDPPQYSEQLASLFQKEKKVINPPVSKHFTFTMYFDDFVSEYDIFPNWVDFQFSNQQNGNTESLLSNSANVTTIVPPSPMSLFDLRWDERPKVTEFKEGGTETETETRTGRGRKGKPCPNKIQKGKGPDAKPDDWDNYDYKNHFFYCGLCSIGVTPPKGKLMLTMCRILREKPRPGQPTLEFANRWATRRTANAYAWLDRQKGKITMFEVLNSLREAKRRLIDFLD